MIPTVVLLVALAMHPQEVMVRTMAEAMGVSPDYAACIVELESGWDWEVEGDYGLAVGGWQWHLGSWRHVRRAMGLSIEDRRHDPVASTAAALWWIRQGHADWWTADRYCVEALYQRNALPQGGYSDG